MADIQVAHLLFSNTELSRSKTMSSSTAKSCSPKRLPVESGTTRMSAWASRLPRKPSKATTSIRNAPSLAMSPSGERSWRASSSQLRCRGPSSSEGITFTMSLNTTGMRRGTETSLLIAHPLSTLKSEILPLLVNADPSPKPSTSMSSRSPLTKSLVTSGNSLCSSDCH